MSHVPVITFKAGACDVDVSSKPWRVNPQPAPGYLYLYKEDELYHFCWRPRSASVDNPTLDLIMFPADGTFEPYRPAVEASDANVRSPTNGRIYILRFSSSSARHLFWLQSKSQHPSGDPSHFSKKDLKLGEIVNSLLQGDEVDVQQEVSNLPTDEGGPGDDDDTMSLYDSSGNRLHSEHHRAASGGAGAGATGGDIRDEGEGSREGGADGGRANNSANPEAQAAVANFLQSLQGSQGLVNQQASEGKPFTTLPDLLQPSTTLPILEDAEEGYLDNLLSHLPPTLLFLSSGAEDFSSTDPDPETVEAVMMSLSTEQKKNILRKVLRSPQFSQSLGSLTMAIRDGGLPTISEALKIKVANGGLVPHGTVPLGGGEAVEAFLEGIKNSMDDDEKMDTMDTD